MTESSDKLALELIGFEALIGKGVLTDPRVEAAFEKVREAAEVFEKILFEVSNEKDTSSKTIQ